MASNAIDFLMYSYFGIDQNDLEKLKESKESKESEIIEVCAQRAYRDLNRTLKFKKKPDGKKGEEKKSIKEDHEKFFEGVCDTVKGQIEILLKKDEDTFDTFDALHHRACEAIRDKADELNDERNVLKKDKKDKALSYGQAQKWLNMTIKYMWLLGLRQTEFDTLLPKLHVPVDSYIMEAIWEEEKEKKTETVKLPMNEGKKREGAFSSGGKEGKVKAWSIWTDEEYKDFQISLRKWCEQQCEKQAPIKWEGPAWIKIAKKRKKK